MKLVITIEQVAIASGFVKEGDGKFKFPATQETADKLAATAASLVPEWKPNGAYDPVEVILTGAGPVGPYLRIAHALHGLVSKLTYMAPNTEPIVVFNHGMEG